MNLFSIPNILTLLNLFSGCLGVVFCLHGEIELVKYTVLISLVADYLDGFVARKLHSASPIGKELDSLADMVSFGVVPAAMFFFMFFSQQEIEGNTSSILKSSPAFILALFAALRLAKFNLDTRQSDNFIGLPTPAVTIFVLGVLEITLHQHHPLHSIASSVYVLYPMLFVLSVLMIAELPLLSLKFKSLKATKENRPRFILLIGCVGFMLSFGLVGCSFSILLYILLSLIFKPRI